MAVFTLPYQFSPNVTLDSIRVNANFIQISQFLNALSPSVLTTLTVYGPTNTIEWAAGVTGDSNPRIALNTSSGLVGGSGSATPDVKIVRSAANTWQIATVGGGAAIVDLNSGTLINTPQLVFNGCRAYLVSGSPYADGAGGGNTTIYWGPCPDRSNLITLDDGTGKLTTYQATQLSLALSLSSGSAYYLWVQNTSGPASLGVTVWTTPTTPPATSTDAAGRLTVSGATNKLIVAGIYALGANTTGDTVAQRHVSNAYNKVPKQLFTTLASAGPANLAPFTVVNTTIGQCRCEYFQAVAAESITATYRSFLQHSAANGVVYYGLARDSVTTPAEYVQYQAYTANSTGAIGGGVVFAPLIGYHYLQQIVGTSGANATWATMDLFAQVFC